MARSYDQPIRDIVDYVFHYEINDPNAWKSARVAVLDAIGCAIESVTKSPACRALIGPVVPDTAVPNGFKVPGTNHQVDPVKGAFDLGVLIRYLDHNDALWGAEWGHPSDNLAAILAVSDWLDRAATCGQYTHQGPPLTVRTLLTALIKAYEIQGCYQMKNAFNAFGIDHVILVKLASASVVAWLLGLTEEQTMATISHVWMDGHPSRVYRSGNNTIPRKGWAAGDACMRAVHLALLVRAGQPGVPEALSSKPFGFFAQTFRTEGFVFERPFESWAIQNVLFKTMPVEGHGIAAVEAALTQSRRLRAMEVQDYDDDSVWARDEEVEAMRAKVIVDVDHNLTRDYHDPDKRSIGSAVIVHLKNGATLSEVLAEYPVGHVRNPRTAGVVHGKFWGNMRLMFSDIEIQAVLKSIEDDETKIMEVVNLLSRESPKHSRL
ncbi:hypothetical protein FE257_005640 [Aspergillus nanangensis]|uniref:2-methylcitrate dehydratase n=1 Tax=Aspergillus nanangensis TaxID=2582783 RepID=A0AAD4GVH0_ASPNN|nr:hypothetical protein FE257_005640 [Aspergillus nanangensis]